MSQSTQAQSESERPYWFEDEMTPVERREYEDYLEAIYWSMRAAEEEAREGAF